MSKIDQQLFTTHEHALEREYGVCPQCGSELAIRHGKHGAFLGCQSYPTCQYHRALVEKKPAIEAEILENTQCPQCSKPLALKSGRYGFYIGCSGFPECDYIAKDEQEAQPEQSVTCPSCKKGELLERTNRFGKKFYACSCYPSCNYLLNAKPLAEPCPECGWPIVTEKSVRGNVRKICPQRACKYQSEKI